MNPQLANWLAQIQYFRGRALQLNPPTSEAAIYLCENTLEIKFDPLLREFLLIHNGGRIVEVHIHGVPTSTRTSKNAVNVYSRHLANRDNPHWKQHWLEIGTDGFGNYFVADLSSTGPQGERQVLLIDHENVGLPDAVSLYAHNFPGFLSRMTLEMIRLYQPDGKLKPQPYKT